MRTISGRRRSSSAASSLRTSARRSWLALSFSLLSAFSSTCACESRVPWVTRTQRWGGTAKNRTLVCWNVQGEHGTAARMHALIR